MCNQLGIPTVVESKSAGMEATRNKPNQAILRHTHLSPTPTQELVAQYL